MTRLSITPEDLRLHSAWLDSESQGVQLIRINANLRGANLRDANLEYANLKGANLKGANLKGANLEDANLWDANLEGANLKGANLKGASLWGANLWGANLRDANLRDAYLKGANLKDAIFHGIAADSPARLIAVAEAALRPGALRMDEWHTCETTHCLAGWAIHQAGETGRCLEAAIGPFMAGLMLLGTEAAQHFYSSEDEVTKFLGDVLAKSELEDPTPS